MKSTRKVGTGYWDNKTNQLDFLERLSKELNFKKLNDWCFITNRLIINKGGSGLLKKYKNSVFCLISSVYSEHIWIQDCFRPLLPNVEHGHWKNKHNQTLALVEICC